MFSLSLCIDHFEQDRLRLIESGQLGNEFDKTAKIHEARRQFRREQRRELHGKQVNETICMIFYHILIIFMKSLVDIEYVSLVS